MGIMAKSKGQTMMEAQNTEFKQAWKDDCIKCLSAFANGDGGVLYVGLDDDGKAVGVKDAKKLLVDIPKSAWHSSKRGA